jgi:hypothetical protein
MADSPAVPPSGTQELFTNFGAEPKLELSSFRGRTVSRASHDSKRSLGRFRFGAVGAFSPALRVLGEKICVQ